MKTLQKLILIILFCQMIIQNANSQEKDSYEGEVPSMIQRDENNNSLEQNQAKPTQAMIDFQYRMKAAKETDNKTELAKIENEIDGVMGTTTVKLQKIENIKAKYNEENENPEYDIIGNGNVAPYNKGYCLETCTEQTGSNTGRIWAILNIEDSKPVSPVLSIRYSDNNGITWHDYQAFQGSYKTNPSFDYDAEIIENGTQKYLWFTRSPDVVGIINLSNNSDYAFYLIQWPGSNIVEHDLRIVSDNSFYANSPYIYFVLTQDSIVYTGSSAGHYLGEKTAVCLNPFTVNPSITYKTTSLKGFVYKGLGPFIDFSCDIAYYKNGGSDSIVFVECGLVNSTDISLWASSIFPFAQTVHYAGSLSPFNRERLHAIVVTNGAYNNIMITNLQKYSSNDWDLEYHRSTNGTSGWSSGYVDFTTANINITTPWPVDMIETRRDPGNFSVAYRYTAPYNLVFCHSENYTWGSLISPYNFAPTTNSVLEAVHAGVNLGANNKGCMAIWSDSSLKIWASFGLPVKLILFGAIQGMYDPVLNTEVPDTIKVYLRNTTFPYTIVDSSKNILLGPGTGQTFNFIKAQNNVPYYVIVKHRNALETWSAAPVTFVNDETSIAYSVNSIYAYGNNEIRVDTSPYNVYAFYSGDVNQDGVIDLTDNQLIDNDSYNFVSGYVKTDLNGDNNVDLADATIAENNAFNFVSLIRP